MDKTDARARLLALAGERRVSLAQLSGLIGRNPAYLQQFVRKGSPRKLRGGGSAHAGNLSGGERGGFGRSEGKILCIGTGTGE